MIRNIIRFCFNSSKTILMFIYFPGYGIQMSTIDPSFLIKEYPLTSKAWFDVKLLMKIRENLPCYQMQEKEIQQYWGSGKNTHRA